MRKPRLDRRGQHQLGRLNSRKASWCRGQAIIEYLLVAAAVILGIVALTGGFTTKIGAIGTEAKDQIISAGDQVGGITAGRK